MVPNWGEFTVPLGIWKNEWFMALNISQRNSSFRFSARRVFFINVRSQLLRPGAFKRFGAAFPNVPVAGIVNADVSNHLFGPRLSLGNTPSPMRFARTDEPPV